jgi:CspA family cold shock protein
MTQGTVLIFNNETGFGVIRDEGGNKVFVHYSEIKSEGTGSLYEGQRVIFDIRKGLTGTMAMNVRLR